MAYIAVVGAANVDIGGFPGGSVVAGDSNPGKVRTSMGGVGRNIACNAARMGLRTELVTALGGDASAGLIRADCVRTGVGLNHALCFPEESTSTYLFIADGSGDMALAVNDMGIYEHITPEFLRQRLDFINHAGLVVVETNLPEASLQWLCQHCTAPILADPVSTIKAPKLLPVLDKLTALKPNRMEAELLSGVPIRDEADIEKAAVVLLDRGVEQVYIALSGDGLYAADRQGHSVRLPCPKVQVTNATGGGDAMAAALAACIAHGRPLAECARLAAGAGALACTAAETIHPGMSWESIEYIVNTAK